VPPATVRLLVAIVLVAHGLGHALGLLPALGFRLSEGHAPGSWLLSGLMGDGRARLLGALCWLASGTAFVGAGVALGGWGLSRDHWTMLASAAAVVSLATVLLFWNGLPFFFPNKVGAILIDVLVLVSVLAPQSLPRLGLP